MNAARDADVAVVGSGIIGTASVLALQQAGLSVLTIEPGEPGAGTASGSAGYLHDGEIFPLAQPALLPQLPRMLLDPFGPLVLRPSYLPHLGGWGIRFLRSMNAASVEREIAALASLNRTSVEALIVMAQQAGAGEYLVQRGGLKVIRDQKTMHAIGKELEDFARAGIEARMLDQQEVLALEPAISSDIAGAVFFPKSAHCIDPQRFGERLAHHANNQVVRGSARSIEVDSSGSWNVVVESEGQNQNITARRVLVSAGYGSGSLLRELGYKVPMAPARGYHLMIGEPSVSLAHPVIFHEPHIAATPMTGGMRIAGTMEFASPQAKPDYRRADMLYELAQRYLPSLKNGAPVRWMGVRPAMPDSLPAIGAASRHPNLYYCFGHGHLGFTQAAVSAACIRDLVTGAKPDIDLAPFDLNRFTR